MTIINYDFDFFFIKNSCTRFPIFHWKRKLEMKKENSFLLVNRPLVFQKLDPYDKNQCELYKKKTRIHLDSLCVFNQATTR
jgi:hypothetical protein